MGDQCISGEAKLAKAAFDHFFGTLGSANARAISLDFNAFDHRSFDLSALELPFSKDEIWRAVKLLPAGKASGPDGFT